MTALNISGSDLAQSEFADKHDRDTQLKSVAEIGSDGIRVNVVVPLSRQVIK